MSLTRVQTEMLRETRGGGVLRGFMFANDAISPNTFFVAGEGDAQDSISGSIISLATGLRKNLAAAWAEGQDLGCLDTGAMAPSTWYHVFSIRNPAARKTDLLASASLSNPLLPAGYTIFERVFSLLSNGSTQIEPFNHNDQDEVHWVAPAVSVSSVNDGQAIGRLRTILAPTGMKTEAILLHLITGTVSFAAGMMDPDIGPATGYNASSYYHYQNVNSWYETRKFTNVNSQVISYSNTPNAGDSVISIVSKGYVDPRRNG